MRTLGEKGKASGGLGGTGLRVSETGEGKEKENLTRGRRMRGKVRGTKMRRWEDTVVEKI